MAYITSTVFTAVRRIGGRREGQRGEGMGVRRRRGRKGHPVITDNAQNYWCPHTRGFVRLRPGAAAGVHWDAGLEARKMGCDSTLPFSQRFWRREEGQNLITF